MNRHFHAKHVNYQNYCIDYNQILHSDEYHQILIMGGPNMHITNPRWQTAAIFEKIEITLSQQQFD